MEKRLITINELAEYMQVHRVTIHNWIKKGLPSIKAGRAVRIDKEKAMEWIMEQSERNE